MQTFLVTMFFGCLFIGTGWMILASLIILLKQGKSTLPYWIILLFIFSGYMLLMEYKIAPSPIGINQVKSDTIFVYEDSTFISSIPEAPVNLTEGK